MMKLRQHKYLLVLLALLVVFAGCKGDSGPTAPPPSSNPGGGSGGSVTPPVNPTLTVTVSNGEPLTSSTSVVTATVTVGGAPAVDGTAVEFSTNLGTFAEVDASATIRTTVGGVARVTLQSSTAGVATVTVTATNVTRTARVEFKEEDDVVITPTDPTITAVAPLFGNPAGGEIITITGTNFRTPLRVLFDFGNGLIKEGHITSSSLTQIRVVTPPIDLGTTQTAPVKITVLTEAGGSNEEAVSKDAAFTYQATQLTPIVTTISPASGPVTGGTRVTLFGEGFQAPMQVFFGAAEAQIISIGFRQVIVISPAGRDTSDNGSGAVTGGVPVRVININSNTSANSATNFRYTPKAAITAVGPTEGPFTGGTRVTVTGIGFEDPVAISFAGFAAQPIRVSGTEIIAITSGIALTTCGDVSGPTQVTNIENGDSATGVAFTYRVPRPSILSVVPTGAAINLGTSVAVTVLNPGLFPRLIFDDISVNITSSTVNGDGTTTFTAVVPNSLQLDTRTCPSGGTAPVATSFDVTYSSAETTCETTLANGLSVQPAAFGTLFLTPNPLNITARAAQAGPPPVAEQDGTGILTVVNNGAAPLTITSVVSSNPQYTISSDPSGTTLGVCESAVIAVLYDAENAGQTSAANITVTATTGTGPTTITARGTVVGTTTP